MLTHKHSRDHLVSFGRRNKKKKKYPSHKTFQCLFVIKKKTCLKYEHEELQTKKESPNHESKSKLL